jgi:hypothetical protein
VEELLVQLHYDYEQKQAELSKQKLLDQKFDFDGTLYVDGEVSKIANYQIASR